MKMNKYNEIVLPETIFLGSSIFYELTEGKIYIFGIISKINNKKKNLTFLDLDIKFFTQDDILNLINMEYLFSHDEMLLKNNINYNNIKRLDLSYEDINDTEFKLITQYFSNNENLNFSHLNINIFPIESFVKLHFDHLKILNLSSNKIYKISNLAKANFHSLEELYNDNNGIMNESIKNFF